MFPKSFARQTNHKKPKYQLYWPGFNPNNSCWLAGDWVDVPEALWRATHESHVEMFEEAMQGLTTQHHRGPATPLSALTEAQRLAYEHYAGDLTFFLEHANGYTSPSNVAMAGNKIKPSSRAWFEEIGAKIIPFVKNGRTGVVTDVLAGLEIPAELVSENTEPRDPWAQVVKQNKTQSQELALALADQCGTSSLFLLFEKEKDIIRAEWELSCGTPDPYSDLQWDVENYSELRAKMQALEGFEAQYERSRLKHNADAREALDASNGTRFYFVLPKFNLDGTHEPWGPLDVPWGTSNGD